MTFEEFLNKETPGYGGCMVCLAKYKIKNYDPNINDYTYKPKEEYMLVERWKIANGDLFIINKRQSYDYDFTWDEETPWEILYKKEA